MLGPCWIVRTDALLLDKNDAGQVTERCAQKHLPHTEPDGRPLPNLAPRIQSGRGDNGTVVYRAPFQEKQIEELIFSNGAKKEWVNKASVVPARRLLTYIVISPTIRVTPHSTV